MNNHLVMAHIRMIMDWENNQRYLTLKQGNRNQQLLYWTCYSDLTHITIKMHEDIPNSYRAVDLRIPILTSAPPRSILVL